MPCLLCLLLKMAYYNWYNGEGQYRPQQKNYRGDHPFIKRFHPISFSNRATGKLANISPRANPHCPSCSVSSIVSPVKILLNLFPDTSSGITILESPHISLPSGISSKLFIRPVKNLGTTTKTTFSPLRLANAQTWSLKSPSL